MGGVFISALHKSSGKTSISIGIAASLKARGLTVQTYKKGPDYIDAMWLTLAGGRPCRNLDYHTMSPALIRNYYREHADYSNMNLVEGNKGLFDGVDVAGTDSNAALAKLLDLSVVLVIDTRGMTRGIAPVIQGYIAFDHDIRIAGIILNQVGGVRHESKLRAALEYYTDVRVIGAVGRHSEMAIAERHLGLVPANEAAEAETIVEQARRALEEGVDVASLEGIACVTEKPPIPLEPRMSFLRPKIRIAVAQDAAFGFYYPDDLEAMRSGGAEIVPFDTLRDNKLPECDGLFIGGGFPETQAAKLSANMSLRQNIREAIGHGLPTYAECGGLMYLSNSINWRGEMFPMIGVIPGDVVMQSKPVGRGYVRLKHTGLLPWPGIEKNLDIAAHEFHYGALKNLPDNSEFAYNVTRGYGIDGYHDGLIIGNTLSTFSHHRNIGGNNWVEHFLSFVREILSEKRGAS